jgi:hypothetical protein
MIRPFGRFFHHKESHRGFNQQNYTRIHARIHARCDAGNTALNRAAGDLEYAVIHAEDDDEQ